MRGVKMSSPQYFAPYYRRFAAVATDYLIAFFGAGGIQSYLLEPAGIQGSSFRLIFFVFSVVYLTTSWWGPLGATPIQFLLRMRVVTSSGERLSLAQAVLRSLLLIGGVVAAMTLMEVPSNPDYLFLAIPVIGVLFAGVFTPNRQAGHDYIARSFVVIKDAVATAENRETFREYVGSREPGLARLRRPGVIDIASAIIAIGLPVFGLYSMALSQFDRELRHRISYAYGETRELRAALQEHYLYENRWAGKNSELGTAVRNEYPDGGYFELEDNGVIRIRFTVIPKLKKIQLVVVPVWTDDELEWQCRTEGDISQAILPSWCRER